MKNICIINFRKKKLKISLGLEPPIPRLGVRRINHCATPTTQLETQNIWFIYLLQFRTVSVAQLPTPYPIPDSKSPYQGLSESVVAFSGTFHFTRLDSGEQCTALKLGSKMTSKIMG